jgi:hypothetical protein
MGYKKYEKKSKTMGRKEKRKDETAMLCGQSKGANEIREDEGMRIVPVGAVLYAFSIRLFLTCASIPLLLFSQSWLCATRGVDTTSWTGSQLTVRRREGVMCVCV